MLTPETAATYIASRPALTGLVDAASITAREVGDGNLNLVFICQDASGRGIVLKQALPYVRLVGPSWPLTEDRTKREADTIRTHSALSADVCRLLDYNDDEHVCALEDLTDHEVFRTRLNAGGPYRGVAARTAQYVADVAFGTSFLALGEEEFRHRAAAAINTELCAITEDLIVTEPYLGADRNSVRPALEPVVTRLQGDSRWVAAAMAMKLRFLTVQEALVHGDLHTGSIFVRGDGADLSVKTFDPEFAFYGPIGFDLGLLWANLLAASARSAALGDAERADGLLAEVDVSWRAFAQRMTQLWPGRQNPGKYEDSFLDTWLVSIRTDAVGFAGCEAARRVIGLAKVSDVETLDDDAYFAAASTLLGYSRSLLLSGGRLDLSNLAPELGW